MTQRFIVRSEQGISLIELLVAVAVFAMLFLMIDGVFISANRSTRQAETGAEVAQNARVAIERLTREIRESGASGSPTPILIGGSAGTMAVVFKSARPSSAPGVFCVNVTSNTEELYRSACNYYAGGPPAVGVTTYAPVWQRYVGYYLTSAGAAGYNLNRVVVNLTTPADALPAVTSLSGGTVVATYVESFDVALSSGRFTVNLRAAGSETASGSPVPTQRIILDDTVLIRN